MGKKKKKKKKKRKGKSFSPRNQIPNKPLNIIIREKI